MANTKTSAATRKAHDTSTQRGKAQTSTASKQPINATKEDLDFLKKYGDQLSSSIMRAKWIHSPDEHEDRKGQTLVTRSPEVIKHWAEERKATPATVPDTQHGDHLGVLRFDFPGFGGQNLQQVSWDQWLDTFRKRNLVFIFQEHKRSGEMSNFFRFDNPTRQDA